LIQSNLDPIEVPIQNENMSCAEKQVLNYTIYSSVSVVTFLHLQVFTGNIFNSWVHMRRDY